MKAVFVCLLRNLKITEDLGFGDKISDSMRITNSISQVSEILTPNYRPIIGDMEASYLLAGNPVVISTETLNDDVNPEKYLVEKLYELQGFLATMWFGFDNAVNFELGFLLYSQNRIPCASSNYIGHMVTNSLGQKDLLILTRDELRTVREIHRKWITVQKTEERFPNTQLHTSFSRLERAMYLMASARGMSDLALKVALYCTTFESLFATSQSELSHQLSERVACFVSDSSEERLLIYRKMKEAYSIRSKAMHGATIKDGKLDDLGVTSQFCDNMLRKIVVKILGDQNLSQIFSNESKDFDEKMTKMIFSGISVLQ